MQDNTLKGPWTFRTKEKFICMCEGGGLCYRENPSAQRGGGNAIPGLHCSWVGKQQSILAMARPWQAHVLRYHLVDAFLQQNIGMILNLQEVGEHASCGPGNLPQSGFTYLPETFMAARIGVYNFSWRDMGVPDLDKMMDIVQVMEYVTVTEGRKIAVHCHAGLGRTGLAIACFLVYSQQYSAQRAVAETRQDRPGALQTKQQEVFVYAFERYCAHLRCLFLESDQSEVPVAPDLDTLHAVTAPPQADKKGSTETLPSGLVVVRSAQRHPPAAPAAGSRPHAAPSSSSSAVSGGGGGGGGTSAGGLSKAELGLEHPLPWSKGFNIQPDQFDKDWLPHPPVSYQGATARQQRLLHGTTRRCFLHLHRFVAEAVLALITAAHAHTHAPTHTPAAAHPAPVQQQAEQPQLYAASEPNGNLPAVAAAAPAPARPSRRAPAVAPAAAAAASSQLPGGAFKAKAALPPMRPNGTVTASPVAPATPGGQPTHPAIQLVNQPAQPPLARFTAQSTPDQQSTGSARAISESCEGAAESHLDSHSGSSTQQQHVCLQIHEDTGLQGSSEITGQEAGGACGSGSVWHQRPRQGQPIAEGLEMANTAGGRRSWSNSVDGQGASGSWGVLGQRSHRRVHPGVPVAEGAVAQPLQVVQGGQQGPGLPVVSCFAEALLRCTDPTLRSQPGTLEALSRQPGYACFTGSPQASFANVSEAASQLQQAANCGEYSGLARAPVAVLALVLERLMTRLTKLVPALSEATLKCARDNYQTLPYECEESAEPPQFLAAAMLLEPLPAADQELLLLFSALLRHVIRASGGPGCEEHVKHVCLWVIKLLLGSQLAQSKLRAEEVMTSFIWYLLRNDVAYGTLMLAKIRRHNGKPNLGLAASLKEQPPAAKLLFKVKPPPKDPASLGHDPVANLMLPSMPPRVYREEAVSVGSLDNVPQAATPQPQQLTHSGAIPLGQGRAHLALPPAAVPAGAYLHQPLPPGAVHQSVPSTSGPLPSPPGGPPPLHALSPVPAGPARLLAAPTPTSRATNLAPIATTAPQVLHARTADGQLDPRLYPAGTPHAGSGRLTPLKDQLAPAPTAYIPPTTPGTQQTGIHDVWI